MDALLVKAESKFMLFYVNRQATPRRANRAVAPALPVRWPRILHRPVASLRLLCDGVHDPRRPLYLSTRHFMSVSVLTKPLRHRVITGDLLGHYDLDQLGSADLLRNIDKPDLKHLVNVNHLKALPVGDLAVALGQRCAVPVVDVCRIAHPPARHSQRSAGSNHVIHELLGYGHVPLSRNWRLRAVNPLQVLPTAVGNGRRPSRSPTRNSHKAFAPESRGRDSMKVAFHLSIRATFRDPPQECHLRLGERFALRHPTFIAVGGHLIKSSLTLGPARLSDTTPTR